MDIDTNIECIPRETNRVFLPPLQKAHCPRNSAHTITQIPTMVRETMRYRVFFESTFCILLLFNYAHATLDTKITDYKSLFYVSETCIKYVPTIFHIPC